jgi:hypothetical protein
VRPLDAVRAASVPLRLIVGILLASFALDNVLLLAFLGHSPLLVGALALIVPSGVGVLAARAVPIDARVGAQTLLTCLAVATALLMLGGEGRFFFATDDWQIRDAVLADMGTHAWPFDYWLEGKAQLLRAPVGMYLLPALLGGASQAARDYALLAHNTVILGLILSAGATLFAHKRDRIVALVIFIMFSGLDVIGSAVAQWGTGHADWEHIERWADNHQFSAHITQLFWVPHHAFASWTCALTYLLWRRGGASPGLFGASIALVALWSPFAIFGALPFALFAGVRSLMTRAWRWEDVPLCLAGATVALPAMLYLRTDAASVGSGFRAMPLLLYVLVIAFEVLPFLVPLLTDKSDRTDRPTLLIAGAILLIVPLGAIGPGPDFQMRTSIMALALVAFALAQWAMHLRTAAARIYLFALLSLGGVTGVVELYRAVTVAPSPMPRCSVVAVWMQQTNTIVPYASYFADRAAFSPALVSAPSKDRAGAHDPAHCWDRPWRQKR